MLTDKLPRFSLAHLPTPLEEMSNLRRALGEDCPRLFIKRDDQTGLATGGNKTRKLEFLLGEALQQSADTVITEGGAQSNHCRQTAAAAVRAGLRCVLVLSGPPVPRPQWDGNLLLSELLGAEVRWANDVPRDEVIAKTAEELRSAGAKPYIIPTGGSIPVGAAGYVDAVEELVGQLKARGKSLNRILLVSGSGGTHAGVLVGVKALEPEIKVEGMNNFAISDLADYVKTLSADTAAFLGLELDFASEDFIFHDACGEHGYGVITEAEREAIRLLARTEAVIADPVYTGRAFGEMVNRIRQGVYRRDETLLFWLTGGVAGLFPRAEEMMG